MLKARDDLRVNDVKLHDLFVNKNSIYGLEGTLGFESLKSKIDERVDVDLAELKKRLKAAAPDNQIAAAARQWYSIFVIGEITKNTPKGEDNGSNGNE